jgi:hypothetical protein
VTDQLVVLQCVNHVEQTCIVKPAGRKVKFAQLRCRLTLLAIYSLCKQGQNFITEEVFVACEVDQVRVWQYCAELLEASRSDFVERHIQLF